MNVWRDFWLSSGPLRDIIKGPLTLLEDIMLVSELYNDNCWNFELLSVELPLTIQYEILGTPPPLYANLMAEDIIIWAFSSNGQFSLKSAYCIAKVLNLLNLNTRAKPEKKKFRVG